jgi:hypothetical protein
MIFLTRFIIFLLLLSVQTYAIRQSRAGIVPGQLNGREFRANRKGVRNLLILVANWRYGLSPLRGPRNDSQLLSDFFSRNTTGLGKYRVVRLSNLNYSDFDETLRESEEPGIENLVFHYSGHGRFYRGKTYLLMPDMEKKRNLSNYPAVSQEQVLSLLKGFRAKRTLMIFDMCDSGADQKGGQNLQALKQGSQEYRKMLESSEGVWQINAARNSAYESRYGKPATYYGDLSWNLIEGLKEGRADGIRGDTKKDGFISVEEIFYYVQRNIKKQMPSSPLSGTGVFPIYEYQNREREQKLAEILGFLKEAEENEKVSAFTDAVTAFSDLKENYLLSDQEQSGIEREIERLKTLSDGWTERVIIKEIVTDPDPPPFPPITPVKPIGAPPASAKARELFERAKDLAAKCLKWEKTSQTRAYEHCKEAVHSLDEIMEREPESDLAVKILLGDLSVEGFDRAELEGHVHGLQAKQVREQRKIDRVIDEVEVLVRSGRRKKVKNPVHGLRDLQEGWEKIEVLMQTYHWSDQVAQLGGGSSKIDGSSLGELRSELESLRTASTDASRAGAKKANILLVKAYKAIRVGKGLRASNLAKAYPYFEKALRNIETLGSDYDYTTVGKRVVQKGFQIDGYDLRSLQKMRDKALEEKRRLERERAEKARLAKEKSRKRSAKLARDRQAREAQAKIEKLREEKAAKASSRLRKTGANTIGMQFVLVQPGRFKMGSNNGDSDEKPAHRVKITRGFYLGKYEVTQGEWEAVMGSNPSRFKSCGANCPVEEVSYEDVQKFIKVLNTIEGCPTSPKISSSSGLTRGSIPSSSSSRPSGILKRS